MNGERMIGGGNSRALEIVAFLDRAGWDEADQIPMDADFGARRYARLRQADGRHAVLMDAGPDQKTREFVVISTLLRQADLSAPEIYAADPIQGLALVEDFGVENYGAVLDRGCSETERENFYKEAAAMLAQLHQKIDALTLTPHDLPHFDANLFTQQAGLFIDAYLPTLDIDLKEGERATFDVIWHELLQSLQSLPQSLILRDFMPDNVMALTGRTGVAALGLIDFQDGGLGPVAYDLASLCETVRRDGGDQMLPIVIAEYQRHASQINPMDLTRACVILSAQRHLRILGILARLATQRPEKAAYLPRVKARLMTLLADPALTPLRDWLVHNDIELISST